MAALVAAAVTAFPVIVPLPAHAAKQQVEAEANPNLKAPLLRMPAGIEVIITLRNSLAVSASVFGLHARPAGEALPVRTNFSSDPAAEAVAVVHVR